MVKYYVKTYNNKIYWFDSAVEMFLQMKGVPTHLWKWGKKIVSN